MTKRVYLYLLLMFLFCSSCDIKSKTKNEIPAGSTEMTNNIDEWDKLWKIKEELPITWYSETASQGIIIQSGFPRGGGYTDATGKIFECRTFWNRVVNESATPIELTINFPADSVTIVPSPDFYLKLFFPPDTLTLGNEGFGLSDFVATGFESLLGPDKPPSLQITINPKEEYLFYIGAAYQPGGAVRAGLVLKEQDLFFRIGIIPHFEAAIFPCGQIVLKK